MEHNVVTDYTNVSVENAAVKVYVRARPPEAGLEPGDIFQLYPDEPRRLTFKDPNNRAYGEQRFLFDGVFWSETEQNTIFESAIKPQVDHCLNGYNCCCFAYGQTGSGKTYSIFGEEGEERGAIPRTIDYLFGKLDQRAQMFEVALVVSFLEIYCDRIRDLGRAYLDKTGAAQAQAERTSDMYDQITGFRRASAGEQTAYERMSLEIHEDAESNVFVKDLSLIPISTPEEAIAIIQMGLKLRATHETRMNSVSSRSHTVFTVTVVQKDRRTGTCVQSLLNMIDLAGSERLKKSDSQGPRLREALNINSSLSALGKVVMALDPNSNREHIPYRDSKLTRLLQNSLGGNSYTSLLATVHPVGRYADECLSTLQFANRCRNVINNPRVNYSGTSQQDKDRRIRRLLEEVNVLKRQLLTVSATATHQAMTVLEELGIQGEMQRDGTIQLSDGRVVGQGMARDLVNAAAAAAESAGGAGMDAAAAAALLAGAGSGAGTPHNKLLLRGSLASGSVRSPAGSMSARSTTSTAYAHSHHHFGGGGGAGGAHAHATARDRRRLAEAERDLHDHKRKLAQHREDFRKMQEASHRETQELYQTQHQQRKTIADLQATLANKEAEYAAAAKTAAAEHQQQLQELAEHNTRLLGDQHELLATVPDSLRVSTGVLDKAHNAAAVVRAQEQAAQRAQVDALKKSHAEKLAHLREQYEYWLNKRKTDMEGFVEEFNAFRSAKADELRQLKGEAKELFVFAAETRALLDRILDGDFPLQQGTGGDVVCVPPELVAADAVREPGRLAALKAAIGIDADEAARRVLQAKRATAPARVSREMAATAALPRKGRARPRSSGASRPASATCQQQQPGSFGFGGSSRRPASATVSVPARQQQRPVSGGPPPVTARGRLEDAERRAAEDADLGIVEDDVAGGDEFDAVVEAEVTEQDRRAAAARGVDLAADVDAMDADAVREHARRLAAFVASGLREQVEEQVFNDLADHQTVEYIRQMEDERARYRELYADEQRRHRQLRVAFESQARQLGAGPRPGSAAKQRKPRSRPASAHPLFR